MSARQDSIPETEPDETAIADVGVITDLAVLPERSLVGEAWLAKALGVTERTIRNMVTRYELPPPVRLGGRSMWLVGRVLDYIDGTALRMAEEAMREAERIRELEAD